MNSEMISHSCITVPLKQTLPCSKLCISETSALSEWPSQEALFRVLDFHYQLEEKTMTELKLEKQLALHLLSQLTCPVTSLKSPLS